MIMKTVKIYRVESKSAFAGRTIQARTKKEAKLLFKQQLKSIVTDDDVIVVK